MATKHNNQKSSISVMSLISMLAVLCNVGLARWNGFLTHDYFNDYPLYHFLPTITLAPHYAYNESLLYQGVALICISMTDFCGLLKKWHWFDNIMDVYCEGNKRVLPQATEIQSPQSGSISQSYKYKYTSQQSHFRWSWHKKYGKVCTNIRHKKRVK